MENNSMTEWHIIGFSLKNFLLIIQTKIILTKNKAARNQRGTAPL